MKIRYTLAVACAWMVAATAQAAPITYTFGGTLGQVNESLRPSLAVGDAFTGSFSIESTAPDVGIQQHGVYIAGYSMNVTVRGYSYSSSVGNVEVIHDGTSWDQFLVINVAGLNGGVGPVTGPALGGLQPKSFNVLLWSSDSHVLNSTALPTSLSLPSFDIAHHFAMIFDGDNAVIAGTLTSLTQITAAPVPEASTSAMLALGLGALAVVRRRQRS